MKKILISALNLFVVLVPYVLQAAPIDAQTTVSRWQKAVSIVPTTATDFAGDHFKASVNEAKQDGVNYIDLIIPFYQHDIHSSVIYSEGNTPSDASIQQAIAYIHRLSLHVILTPHIESDDGAWRAYINPTDRDAWYSAYTNELVHYASLGQQQQVEEFCIGTELVDTASYAINADNTSRFDRIIASVRKVFAGKIFYDANYGFELDNIGFFNRLDYVGISGYYDLTSQGDASVSQLEDAWDRYIQTISYEHERYTKPVLFSEIGYRSMYGANIHPWDSTPGGVPDMQEQVNDYTALFDYWSRYSWMQGVSLWWWNINPHAGGINDSDYTPQGKPAEQVMRHWFLGE